MHRSNSPFRAHAVSLNTFLFRRAQRRVYTVELVDGSCTRLLLDPRLSASDTTEAIAEKLGVPNPEEFGLATKVFVDFAGCGERVGCGSADVGLEMGVEYTLGLGGKVECVCDKACCDDWTTVAGLAAPAIARVCWDHTPVPPTRQYDEGFVSRSNHPPTLQPAEETVEPAMQTAALGTDAGVEATLARLVVNVGAMASNAVLEASFANTVRSTFLTCGRWQKKKRGMEVFNRFPGAMLAGWCFPVLSLKVSHDRCHALTCPFPFVSRPPLSPGA